MKGKYPIVTLCGSTRYSGRITNEAERLTSHGWIVLAPFVDEYPNRVPTDKTKHMLDDMHRSKIDLSDAILVIGEHRDKSTLDQIAYARSKEIVVYDSEKPNYGLPPETARKVS